MENIFASSKVRLSKEEFKCGFWIVKYKNTYEKQMFHQQATNENVWHISVTIINEVVAGQSQQLQ